MSSVDRSQKSTNRSSVWVTQGILIILSIFAAMPLLWMITTALKPTEQTLKNPPVLIPHPVLWENFPKAFTYNADKLGYTPFLVYAINTMMLVVLSVSGVVISNAMVGYSFARLKWPGRDFVFALTLATMMIPFPVLMVPQFAMFKAFHWIGTYRPLWVPAWFAGAFNIFLLRQFFRSIPFELSEAAKLDGCTEWGIFQKVILPLAKPALAVVALFALMGTWNDFLGPIIYLQDQKQFTLAVGLNFYKSQAGGTDMNVLMAASTMVILPIVVLYFFTQKLFIQGIAATGLKG